MTEENNQENKEASDTNVTETNTQTTQQKAVVKHVMAPPPPPPHPNRVSPFSSAKKEKKAEHGTAAGGTSSGKWDNNFAADMKLPPSVLKTKNIMMIAGGVLLAGIVMGCVLFGGGNSCPPCQDSAFGVVRNPEMPKKTKRCGVAERFEVCKLLLSNARREEVKVRDMYDQAVALTDVQKYRIDSLNIRYANETIKPGYIAEIVIPSALQ